MTNQWVQATEVWRKWRRTVGDHIRPTLGRGFSTIKHNPVRDERRRILPQVDPNGEEISFRILSGKDGEERTYVCGTAATLGLYVGIDEFYLGTQIRDENGITPFVGTDSHS